LIRPSVTGQAVGNGDKIRADRPSATGEVDYRRLANYQRAKIRSLEARVQELERRRIALLAVLLVGGSGALGGALLAVTARLKPPPTEATSVTAAPGLGNGSVEKAGPAPPFTRR
jgi:hypothetical protein